MRSQNADETSQDPPRAFAPRLAVAYASVFAVTGLLLPYFPVWLKSLSLSDTGIGFILSIPMIVRVTTAPFIAARADRGRDRVDFLIGLSFLSLLAMTAFVLADDFRVIAVLVAVQTLFFAPLVPLVDAITLTGVRRHAADYGRIRLWGSVAFIVSNVAGGVLIAAHSGSVVLPMLIGVSVLTAFAAPAVPRFGRPRSAGALANLSVEAAGRSLRRPDFLMIMVGGALIQGSHAMLYAFSTIYWSAQGISGTTIGLLWATGVVGEVLLFRLSAPLLRRIGVKGVLMAGGCAAVLRWLLFPLGPGLAGYFCLQLAHAGSFGAIHIVLQRVIAERVADEKGAAAQGLMFCLINAGLGGAMLTTGYLYSSFGVDGFFAMAGLALAGLLLALRGLAMPPPGQSPTRRQTRQA